MNLTGIRACAAAARAAADDLRAAAAHVPDDHARYALGLATELRRLAALVVERASLDDSVGQLGADERDEAVLASQLVELESLSRAAWRETRRLERVARVRSRRRRRGATS